MRNRSRLLFAIVATAALAAPACASSGRSYRYPDATRQISDRAYRNGYDEGLRRGEDDGRRGRSFDYGRHSEYRNANAGYGGYGNRNEYRDIFRQGFVAGYDQGYRRYGRNGSGYPTSRYPGSATPRYPGYPSGPVYGDPRGGAIYGSPAYDNGYRDGLEQGRKDARKGDRFDPVRAGDYRNGDRGYNNRYGSRDDYKRAYRDAFQRGYEQGYRRG